MSARSPPSPLTPPRALTPPPRRPRTPVTPAPASPRVNTVPLPDISPFTGPVPITVTGPSTPIAGVFGMMGLNLEPGAWSIGPAVPAYPFASLPNSAGASGAGTPTRSYHVPHAMSPAGLMALHNSFDRYEREERRWVASATSTPAVSTPPSPESGSLALSTDDATQTDNADQLVSHAVSRPTPEPLILPTSTHLAFPLPNPRLLPLEEIRQRGANGVLTHWPAVTRVAGHTVIHRAVPGKPEEYAYLEGDSSTVDPSPFSSSPETNNLELAPSRSNSLSLSTRRPSHPSSPAIFGPDIAGPLAARIARSRAAGTPEARWAWGAPAIRAAAWGVLEHEPPLESVTAAHPHSHASVQTVTTTNTSTQTAEEGDSETSCTTTENTTTTTIQNCTCADSPIIWGEGGAFTTRLGSFLFAPPLGEEEAAEMRVAASIAAAELTVCDGACGCAQEVTLPNGDHDDLTPTESVTQTTPTTSPEKAAVNSAVPATTSASPVPPTTPPTVAEESGLLGLSPSPRRLSLLGGEKKEKKEEKEGFRNERELRDEGGVETCSPPATPPTVPVAIPEATSPRSRRLGNLFTSARGRGSEWYLE